jgi:hypothetical protein
VAQLSEPPAASGPRLVLLCEPATTAISPMADALLVPPTAITAPFRQLARYEHITLAQALGLEESRVPPAAGGAVPV